MATYLQIADLKDDHDFRRRVGVAIIRYASWRMGQPATEEFHEQRINWARRAMIATDEQVYRLMGFVIGDGTVQAELESVSDAALQSIVETHINQNMAVLV